jgi:archaetidylinositol phosphate synthase
MRDISSHKRVNDIFFGPVERPVLQWLAEHMPAWVNPDILTGVGVFGSVIIFSGYWLTLFNKNFLWLASFGFVINWLGDSMDGTLARYRNIQRPRYGFFIDHTMDALTVVLIFTGLGLSSYVRFEIAVLTLIGYLLMSILVYVRTCVDGEFKISYAKLGPTEMRLIAISSNTLVYFIGNPVINFGLSQISLYDVIALGLAILLFAAFIISCMIQANELAKIDA